jgi:hypothetical protein
MPSLHSEMFVKKRKKSGGAGRNAEEGRRIKLSYFVALLREHA